MNKMIMKSFLSIFFFFVFLCGVAEPAHALSENLSQLEQAPLSEVKLPKLQRKKLKNGMRLLMLPSADFPTVQGVIYIKTGSIYEPADQIGVAALTGELIRTGGTKALTPQAMDQALAQVAAKVSSSIEREYGVITFQCLVEDLPKVLSLIFQMLREPAFEENKFQLAKLQLMESIRRQNDNPTALGLREFAKLIYGKDNIWSRTPTIASVKKLTRKDVIAFYQRFYFPNHLLWGLTGDFQPKELEKTIRELSKGWPKNKTALPELPRLQKRWEAGLYLAPKVTDQTTVVLGHFGERRFNPDKFALLVLNDILGGSTLNSRLGERIRSNLGLAYGVYSRFGLETDYGLFYIFSQTKAARTHELLEESRKILNGIVAGKITEAELIEHKRSIVQSLYAQYEPPFRYVQEEARLAYLGYPPNYLQYFRDKIEAVSLAEVKRVAKEYLRPDALTILIVGDPQKLPQMPKAKRINLEIL